jgi:hypothetical protein
MDQKVGSANDWVTMYDRNGDGMLDVSELQDLQTRLSKQMTDNIQLTKHLNTLETRCANHTTELKEKEVTLRKALEAMDYARTIQNELRSKLALSEQNHTMLSAEVSRLAGIERFCVFSSFRIYLCKLPSFPSFYCLLHFPAVDLSFFSNHLPLPLPWPLSHTFASLMSFLFHAPLFVVNSSLFVSFKKHVSKKQCLINVLVRNKETRMKQALVATKKPCLVCSCT